MTRVLTALLLMLTLTLPATAQDDTATMDPTALDATYRLRVVVDGAFIRVLPDAQSDAVTSTFEEEVLFAVGRNADGTWFEVRRPNRDFSARWVFSELVQYSFSVEDLPLTDLTTGVIGPDPVFDTGRSVFILLEASLRRQPGSDAERLAIIPVGRTLPVLGRTRDNQRLQVNYLGTMGWVAEFLTRTSYPLTALEITDEGSAPLLSVEVIPPETQLAQVDRLQAYLDVVYAEADTVTNFWFHEVVSKSLTHTVPTPRDGGGNPQLSA